MSLGQKAAAASVAQDGGDSRLHDMLVDQL
jgi:hypothetical protein